MPFLRPFFAAFVCTQLSIYASALQSDLDASSTSVAETQANTEAGVSITDPSLQGTPLSIEEALVLARSKNPQLLAAVAEIARSKAVTRTARQYTNPSFQYLAGPQSARPIATPGVPGLLQHYSATQTIEIPLERRLRIQAAKLGQSSSEFGQDSVRLGVEAEVRRAFYAVLQRREQIGYAQQNLGLVNELRRRTAVEVQVGEKGRLELTRAEAEMANARSQVRAAQIELVSALAGLRATIGTPPELVLNPQGAPSARTVLPPLNDLRARLVSEHPVLAQARTDVSRAEVEVKDQRALRIPKPELYGEYERQPDLTYYRLGATIQIPLWNRRGGEIDQAKAEQQRAQAAATQRGIALTAALERAYGQYEVADQQVTSLEAGALRQAEAAVQGATAAYKFGERGILEVLDAQRVLQSVRSDLLDARYARESSLIDLQELGVVGPGGRP